VPPLATIKINGVIRQSSVWLYVKDHIAVQVHAQYHVSLERCRKSFTTIVLGDHDFPLNASNFGNLTAFIAILAVFSPRMRKNGRLFMNFPLQYGHHRSIP